MKSKLTLLAAVILAGIGTGFALDTATPVADKPVGMGCCSKMQKAPAPTAVKDVPATPGMSCHSDAPANKEAAPVKAKGCCK